MGEVVTVTRADETAIMDRPLAELDPEVAAAIAGELHRQQSTLEMIASENFAPLAVLQAQGSVLTNKYAEGYPGRRYYGGCEHVDVTERLAIDRVKALFGSAFGLAILFNNPLRFAVFLPKNPMTILLYSFHSYPV